MGSNTARNRRRIDPRTRPSAAASAGLRLTTAAGQAFAAVAAAVALGFCGWLGWQWAHSSPRFAIQQVSFSGLERASEGELLRLAGLSGGQNLFALDVPATERAMAGHPWVRTVTLSRRFPNRLSVKVEEHRPEGLLALGDLYLVDAEGHPFRRVQPGDALDLVLVTGLDREAYVQDAEGSAAKVAAALEVVRAYQAQFTGAAGALSEARVEVGGGVALITARGEEVRLGEGEVDQKLRRLAQVRRELAARSMRAAVVHLDNRTRPGWVAVKPWVSDSERSGDRQ